MREPGLFESIIVTREESKQISVMEGIIDVIPVWRFLLEKHVI